VACGCLGARVACGCLGARVERAHMCCAVQRSGRATCAFAVQRSRCASCACTVQRSRCASCACAVHRSRCASCACAVHRSRCACVRACASATAIWLETPCCKDTYPTLCTHTLRTHAHRPVQGTLTHSRTTNAHGFSIRTWTQMNTGTDTHTPKSMHPRTCTHPYTSTCMHAHTHAHTHPQACMHTHTLARTYAFVTQPCASCSPLPPACRCGCGARLSRTPAHHIWERHRTQLESSFLALPWKRVPRSACTVGAAPAAKDWHCVGGAHPCTAACARVSARGCTITAPHLHHHILPAHVGFFPLLLFSPHPPCPRRFFSFVCSFHHILPAHVGFFPLSALFTSYLPTQVFPLSALFTTSSLPT